MAKKDSAKTVREKRPPRTLKEKKFAYKMLVEQKPATIAALEVYDVHNSKNPYKTASTIATENMEKLSFDHYFAKMGLTDEAIAANVSEMALKAKKRDHFSGEYEPDYNVRLKATDLALKVMNKMPKEPQTTNNIIVTPILGGLTKLAKNDVQPDDGDREDSEAQEAD